MLLNEYQDAASATAVYPNRGSNLTYSILGLCGESGELAEKLKKCIRDGGGMLDEQTRLAMSKELGDVLWYVAATAFELGLSLDTIAELNLAKLASRKDRGVVKGSGDER